mmetsp:Transcript_25692/g.59891  ORF Transcript_25692/g.59891 Transcript_25692/m.59891 type:complete len:212 (-) Transcript_25692:2181-2816(-)
MALVTGRPPPTWGDCTYMFLARGVGEDEEALTACLIATGVGVRLPSTMLIVPLAACADNSCVGLETGGAVGLNGLGPRYTFAQGEPAEGTGETSRSLGLSAETSVASADDSVVAPCRTPGRETRLLGCEVGCEGTGSVRLPARTGSVRLPARTGSVTLPAREGGADDLGGEVVDDAPPLVAIATGIPTDPGKECDCCATAGTTAALAGELL